jgi:hypothetical protein
MASLRVLGPYLISCFAASSWLACGARVVVDPSDDGGTTTTSGGGGAGSCTSPPLVGDVLTCPKSPPPDPAFCVDWTLCDTGGHRWRTQCDATGCRCLVDDHELCACAFSASPCPGATCCDALFDDGVPCCPYPWLGHAGCKPAGESCTLNAECCNYSCTDGLCDP